MHDKRIYQKHEDMGRRNFLRVSIITAAGSVLVACAPEIVERTVEVPGETLVETVEVEVEGETVIVTATPEPRTGEIAYLKFVGPESDPDNIAAVREQIEKFQEANPNIRVELQFTGPEAVLERTVAAMTTGAGQIDILQPDSIIATLLAEGGYLLPIDDVVEELGGEEFWYPNSLLRAKDGHIYGAPYASEPYLIWYRKDLFDADGVKAPTTWEEFEEAAKHFTQAFNPDSPTEFGITLPFATNKAGSWMAAPFLWSNGADFFDKDLNLALDSPETIEFLEWYTSLYQYTSELSTGYNWGDMINNFLSGQSAMTIYSGRILGRLYRNAPDLVGKAAVTMYPKRKLQATWDDPNMLIISAATPYPDAAKAWLNWYYTGEATQDILCSVPTHFNPATKEQEEWYLQDTTGCTPLDENPDIRETFFNSRPFAYNPMTNAGGILEAAAQGKDRYVATGVKNPAFSVAIGTTQPLAEAIQNMVVNNVSARQALDAILPGLEQSFEQTKEEIGL